MFVHLILVYTAQENSTFGQALFTSEQPKKNKMASRFASISEEEILSMNGGAVPKNTNMATKFGVTVFSGKFFNLSNHIF